MRKIIELTLVAGVLLAVAACNTVHGAGKDVQSAGSTIANAAK